MGRPLLEIHGLVRRFSTGDQQIDVLKGINLSIHAGEMVAIIGASGSGKSTLLRCINHMEVEDEGEIYIDGQLLSRDEKRINTIRADIGMVCTTCKHRVLIPRREFDKRVKTFVSRVPRVPPSDLGPLRNESGLRYRFRVQNAPEHRVSAAHESIPQAARVSSRGRDERRATLLGGLTAQRLLPERLAQPRIPKSRGARIRRAPAVSLPSSRA